MHRAPWKKKLEIIRLPVRFFIRVRIVQAPARTYKLDREQSFMPNFGVIITKTQNNCNGMKLFSFDAKISKALTNCFLQCNDMMLFDIWGYRGLTSGPLSRTVY